MFLLMMDMTPLIKFGGTFFFLNPIFSSDNSGSGFASSHRLICGWKSDTQEPTYVVFETCLTPAAQIV